MLDNEKNETDEKADDVQKPSTENEPGEEAKAPKELRDEEPEPSHEAVGIGIIGRPQTAIDDSSAS